MIVEPELRTVTLDNDPCKQCGCTSFVLRERSGQDTAWCSACDTYGKNVSRVDAGRRQQTVSTVHAAIKPKQRSRILARAGGRCEVCGARTILHVGHIIGVSVGLRFGVDSRLLNDDENLMSLCEECNLGQGHEPMSLPMAIALLRVRVSWRERDREATS